MSQSKNTWIFVHAHLIDTADIYGNVGAPFVVNSIKLHLTALKK